MTTKVTIEVDGEGSIQTQAPSSGTAAQGQPAAAAAQAPSTPATDAGNNAGSAPGLDASQVGPVPFVGAAGSASAAMNPAFNPEGAISAGPAPAELMGGAE